MDYKKVMEKSKLLEKSIVKQFSSKNIYSAIIDYAELIHSNFYEEKPKITSLIESIDLNIMIKHLNSDISRFEKILSFGDRWDEDEILLLFTYLIKFKTLEKIFNTKNIKYNSISQFEYFNNQVDIERNSSSIKIAKNYLEKNCLHLPLNGLLENLEVQF